MVIDQKKTNTIRQVRSSLKKDSSTMNKQNQVKTLKAQGINMAQYNNVIKSDIVREQSKAKTVARTKSNERSSGLGM